MKEREGEGGKERTENLGWIPPVSREVAFFFSSPDRSDFLN